MISGNLHCYIRAKTSNYLSHYCINFGSQENVHNWNLFNTYCYFLSVLMQGDEFSKKTVVYASCNPLKNANKHRFQSISCKVNKKLKKSVFL